MVAALGLGKFYGGSLPRPRFYEDVKFNGERVDPPLPVTDALMAWAEEAHWSMGGACTTRRRLQGRIEGNVDKLRVQRDTVFKKSGKQQKSASSPATRVVRRRRLVRLVVEEEEKQSGLEIEALRRKLGKKSGTEAGKNEVQSEIDGGGVVPLRKSKRKEADAVVVETESDKLDEKSAESRRRIGAAAGGGIRSSPRLARSGRSR